ncbi:MAG: hypothetical protein IKP96_03075 [Elusimicrobiaceae bacterium]|nr:hypothetical protein [Elusimicrobiaceae bacterium]
MKKRTRFLAKKSFAFLVQVFFSLVKMAVVVVALTMGVLIAGQSSVAPVSMRLLTSYGMEYAVSTFKPYRHLFPKPYAMNFETK